MRILGVDCGAGRTGYGVIESDGRFHRLIASGVIRTLPKNPLASRLHAIGRELRLVIASYSPQAAAVEGIFFAVNVRSALTLAQVRGAVLFTIADAGLALGEYSPSEIKTSVVGYGRAEKRQVQYMIQSLLGLDAILESEDASDAVAVAICHATRSATAAVMEASR